MFARYFSLSVRQLILTIVIGMISCLGMSLTLFTHMVKRAGENQVSALEQSVKSSADALALLDWEGRVSIERPLEFANLEDGAGLGRIELTAFLMDGDEFSVISRSPGFEQVIADDEFEVFARKAVLHPGSEAERAGDLPEGFVQKIWTQMGEIFAISSGRNRTVTSWAPITIPGQQTIIGGTIGTATYSPEVISRLGFIRMAAAGCILGLLPAILFGSIASNNTRREIEKIAEAIKEIQGGSLAHRIEVERQDVIGQAQRGFNELSDHLENARTRHEAAMSELIASKKEAEVATEAKSDFLANISHEIRTPMNGVIGTTSLLLESDVTDQQRELLQIIQSSGESLTHIINDVLDYSKLESARMTLDERAIQPRHLIEEITDMFAFTAAGANLELIQYVDTAVPEFVYGDFERIKQILVNMVGNAIKFTPNGEIVIQAVSIPNQKSQSGVTSNLQFSVRDSGIGIPEDKLETIFEAFQQADVSTTRKFGGSGLGLAISRKLSSLMSGRIYAKSELDVGSEFFFEMPCKLVPTQEQNQGADQERLHRPMVQGQRAAIICANDSLAGLLRFHCQRWGMEAIPLPSLNDETLPQLAEANPSLVVFDSSGLEAQRMESFANLLATRQVPSVILTRLGEDSLLPESARTPGPTLHILTKPCREKELLYGLANVASRGRLNEERNASKKAEIGGKFSDQYPARILLVEDQPMNQKIVSLMLNKLGYDVDVANNGREGVDRVKQEQNYDLIFMDLQMPVLGGLDATEEIRSDFLLARQPTIVAMTGHALPGVRDSCSEAGMDGFMTKPVAIDDLRNKIERMFTREKEESTAA